MKAVGLFIFVVAAACRLLFWPSQQAPEVSELDISEGVIQSTQIGGDGEATSIVVWVKSKPRTFRSFLGRAWPGMERLKRGDAVRVASAPDRAPRGRSGSASHPWIWELSRTNTGESIVTYDAMRAHWVAGHAAMNQLLNVFGVLGLALLGAGLLRAKLTASRPEGAATGHSATRATTVAARDP